MRRILLLHLDGRLPNVALMRVAAHHRTLGFQRWVVGAYDKRIPWGEWSAAHFQPRKLVRREQLGLLQGSA